MESTFIIIHRKYVVLREVTLLSLIRLYYIVFIYGPKIMLNKNIFQQ